eukprot:jgi/Pico_ML_1/54530/g4864.t1
MDPLRDDPNTAYVELARGHGEVLASGAFPGVPVRLRLSKTPGTADYTVLSLDAYNVRLAVQDDGRLQERWAQEDATGNEEWADILEDAVPKLREVCLSLEREFQGPQDVEGCLTEDGEVGRVPDQSAAVTLSGVHPRTEWAARRSGGPRPSGPLPGGTPRTACVRALPFLPPSPWGPRTRARPWGSMAGGASRSRLPAVRVASAAGAETEE